MSVQYEKPRMSFVSLRNENKVANTCWGGSGKPEYTWYYDIKDPGYMSFQIDNGNCGLGLVNIYYYKYKGATPVPVGTDDPRYKEMYQALIKSGGAAGNPFKGETIDFPLKPDPEWS